MSNSKKKKKRETSKETEKYDQYTRNKQTKKEQKQQIMETASGSNQMSYLTDLKAVIINMLKELKETVIKVKKWNDDNIISNSQYKKEIEIIKKTQIEILKLESTYN